MFGGQYAIAGNIIVRQRGTKFNAGENVYMGKDHTLHARIDGVVQFERKRKNRSYVSILPVSLEEALLMEAPAKPKAKKESQKPKAEKVKKEASVAKAKPEAVEQPKETDSKSTLLKNIGDGSGSKDDLKKISGVGPKFEELLNSIGIISFGQIAKMSDEDLDLMDSLTGKFPGRAKRDDWVGQAKSFLSDDEEE